MRMLLGWPAPPAARARSRVRAGRLSQALGPLHAGRRVRHAIATHGAARYASSDGRPTFEPFRRTAPNRCMAHCS